MTREKRLEGRISVERDGSGWTGEKRRQAAALQKGLGASENGFHAADGSRGGLGREVGKTRKSGD